VDIEPDILAPFVRRSVAVVVHIVAKFRCLKMDRRVRRFTVHIVVPAIPIVIRVANIAESVMIKVRLILVRNVRAVVL
jgi:hypothetical protein